MGATAGYQPAEIDPQDYVIPDHFTSSTQQRTGYGCYRTRPTYEAELRGVLSNYAVRHVKEQERH